MVPPLCCLTASFHGARQYRLDARTSVADRCGSYQTSPDLEIPLEHVKTKQRRRGMPQGSKNKPKEA